MLHIIWYIIVGFIVGLIARAIMPGAQHLGFIMTTVLGIAGSIIGGLVGRLFSRPAPCSAFHPAGFIMLVVCAILPPLLLGKYGGVSPSCETPFLFFAARPLAFSLPSPRGPL